MKEIIEAFGALKSPFDARDYKLVASGIEEFPETFKLPVVTVKNQGGISSCVAHAASSVVEYHYKRQHNKKLVFSTEFIYGLRDFGYYVGEGMYIRNALSTLRRYGDVPLSDLKGNNDYLTAMENVNSQSYELLDKAYPHRISYYFRIYSENAIKSALMNHGYVLAGMKWHKGAKLIDGVYTPTDEVSGGHAIVIYGWNKKGWLCQNSWGCYDKNTEVLTKDGFKKFSECSEEDVFATINASGELEYQKAVNFSSYHHVGKMYNYQSSKIDLCVTPNHNMYYRTKKSSFRLEAAENISHKCLFFKRTAEWKGKDIEYFYLPAITKHINKSASIEEPGLAIKMEDWMEFLGYYISEGSCHINDYTKYGKGHGYITLIDQVKPQSKDIIRKLLSRLPFNFSETKKGFSISNQQLYEFCSKLGTAYDKYIPSEFLELSPKYLDYLFRGLMLGDGSSVTYKNGSYKNTYYTSSSKLKDQFQELCLKLGYATSVYEDNRIGREQSNGVTRYINYQIRIQKYKTDIGKDHGFKKTPIIADYDDMVYCVEVPNHTLFVRRNGKTCWCGNSHWGNKGRFIIPFDFKFSEIWGITDNITDDIVTPKRSKIRDVFYKIYNAIVNLFIKND